MTKTVKIYIGVLILLFLVFVAIEFSKPKPINWSRTYNETHKRPYGTYILYNEFATLFPSSDIKDLAKTPYEFFDHYYDWENDSYTINGNYVYIDEAMNIDEISAQELLDFANHGNTVFLSSSTLPQLLKDSLKIDITTKYDFTGAAAFRLANSRFKKDSIHFNRGISNLYFSKVDTLSTTVLGYQKFNKEEEVNFIKIKRGQGQFLLHLQPFAFTNYNLLQKNNKKYASSVLAYLPNHTIFFDSRNKKRYQLSNSPLRFILSQPALKWGWLMALIVVVIFMVFNAKRKQRIVNVINPLRNTTIDFAKTIGNLYYETKDHNNLVHKKITFFLEYLRRTYYINTETLDEKFIKTLASKSGHKNNDIRTLINTIILLNKKRHCTEGDLIRLNRVIDHFHNI